MFPNGLSLPQRHVPVATSHSALSIPDKAPNTILCAIFSPPSLQATLQRSQLPVGVGAGLLRPQPLEQLRDGPPRLGLEPAAQLLRHRRERVRTPSQPLGLRFGRAVGRTSPSCQAVRSPQRNCSRVGCSIAVHHLGRIGDLDKTLLRCPNVAEQAHRIKLRLLALHPALYLFRRPRIGQQPLIRCGRRVIAACGPSHPRAPSPASLNEGWKKFTNSRIAA